MVEQNQHKNPEKRQKSESRIVEVYPIDKDATPPRLGRLRVNPEEKNGARWLDLWKCFMYAVVI